MKKENESNIKNEEREIFTNLLFEYSTIVYLFVAIFTILFWSLSFFSMPNYPPLLALASTFSVALIGLIAYISKTLFEYNPDYFKEITGIKQINFLILLLSIIGLILYSNLFHYHYDFRNFRKQMI